MQRCGWVGLITHRARASLDMDVNGEAAVAEEWHGQGERGAEKYYDEEAAGKTKKIKTREKAQRLKMMKLNCISSS